MVSQPDHHSLTRRAPSSVVGVEGHRGDRHEHYHHPRDRERDRDRDRDRHERHGGGGGSSSRSSMSRSRRYNRSHTGGASTVPQNEFPVFSHSGDVEIVVAVHSGHENRYLLHRHTLTRCSGFFEASTSSEWSRAQNIPAAPLPLPASSEGGARLLAQGTELARVEREGRIGAGPSTASREQDGTCSAQQQQQQQGAATGKRWRYELDHGAGPNDVPMLVQKEESKQPATDRLSPPSSLFGGGTSTSTSSRKHASTAPPTTNSSFFRSVANLSLTHQHRSSCSSTAANLPPPSQSEQDILRDYDNLFRIMYNYPPLLDGVNIADAYVQCKSLLAVADQYDALAVVGPRVDHHLLQFQSRLWRQIAKYPISYLRLGYLARSRIMFQEALIHVVGQWPAGERSLRAALPRVVIDLIEDKADELEEIVSRIESRLFRLGLTTRTGERVSPSTAYLDWLAVSLFRQWLADNMSPPLQPIVPERHAAGSSSSSSSRDDQLTSRTRPSREAGGHRAYDNNNNNSHVTTVVLPSAAPPPLATMGRTYRTLGSTTSVAFLGHDECKRFLKLSGELYTRENLRRFERRVDELKAMAREVVRPLMSSGLELDVSTGAGGGGKGGDHSAVTYLTCIRLTDHDLPWDVE